MKKLNAFVLSAALAGFVMPLTGCGTVAGAAGSAVAGSALSGAMASGGNKRRFER